MESPDTQPLPPPLERLPLDLFQYLCTYVERRSLFSLALASRFCHQAATPQRFSRVRLAMRDREKLHDDLEQWAAVLGRDNRFRHVRRVVVVVDMHWLTDSDSNNDSDGGNDNDSDSDNGSDGDNDSAEVIWFAPGNRPLTPQYKQEQHETWLPFAQFLSQLPGLRDLVYSCSDQMPACVLAALHQHHPRSRLHIGAFSLKSLYQTRDQLHDMDPDEFAVATSPCLYSIFVVCEAYGPQGHLSFNLEAVEQMVSGWAPNLKRAHIKHHQPENWQSIGAAIQAAPRLPWKGFSRQSLDQPTTGSLQHHPTKPARGRLESLTLQSFGAGPYSIEAWHRRADFGTLRRFEVCFSAPFQTFQALASMASQNTFHSLRELGLAVYTPSPPNTTASLDEPTSQILQAVPRLEVLKLSGCFGRRTFETALRRHGQTLRRLSLVPGADDDDNDVDGDGGGYMLSQNDRVCDIQQRCPRLEDVRLYVRRRGGGPDEVAAYRALGQLPRLRRAELWLDCRVAPGGVADRAETIRNTMANCAVDEALARAIFKEMAATTNAPLQRLKLWTDIPDRIVEGVPGFQDVADWIGRSWVCTKDERRGQVTVRETTEERDSESRNSLWGRLEQLEQEGKDAWGALWPRRAEDWRDDWRSFPLRSEV